MEIAAPGLALLSVAEMGRADALAIARGSAGIDLMESAGAAVAAVVRRRLAGGPVAVLCGPGNNGGEGCGAARILRDAGVVVRLGCLAPRDALRGDARLAAERWGETPAPLDPTILDGAASVVDALIGAGLARPLDGVARALVEGINERRLDCVAVDMPSGVDGDSGAIRGAAPSAAVTVTFFRRKPGHLLLPGRLACGAVEIADIGIPETVLGELAPRCWANAPALWQASLRWPAASQHKYSRGHALIFGGAELTGAAGGGGGARPGGGGAGGGGAGRAASVPRGLPAGRGRGAVAAGGQYDAGVHLALAAADGGWCGGAGYGGVVCAPGADGGSGMTG